MPGRRVRAPVRLVAPGDLQCLTSSIDNPNQLVSILVAALVLSTGLAGALRRIPLARFAAFGATALCAAGIFLTGSRGGLVGLTVALIAFLIVGRRWRGRVLVIAVIVGLAGLAISNTWRHPTYERTYRPSAAGRAGWICGRSAGEWSRRTR